MIIQRNHIPFFWPSQFGNSKCGRIFLRKIRNINSYTGIIFAL